METLKPSNNTNSDDNNNIINGELERDVLKTPSVLHREPADEFDPNIFILNEILPQLSSIRPDYWCKIYFMERQYIVGKLYVISDSLTINDVTTSYDGEIFGLNNEHIPHIEDNDTKLILSNFEQGININADENGNICVRNLGCGCVFFKGIKEDSSLSFLEGIYLHNVEIQNNTVKKVFDMNRFKENLTEKLLTLDKDSIDLNDIYDIARWAVCGLGFEPPSKFKMDTDYALTMKLVNITALRVLVNEREFKEKFSRVTNPEKCTDPLEIQITGCVDTLKTYSDLSYDKKVLRQEIPTYHTFNAPMVWDKEYTEEFDPIIFMLKDSMPRLCSIGSEYWGKMYILERQTVVGKSYLFAENFTVDDSDTPYYEKIYGLRHDSIPHIDDIETEKILMNFNKGINIIIDEHRNIFVRNLGCQNVFIRGFNKQSSLSFSEAADLHNQEIKKNLVKIFDLNRFREKVKDKILTLDKETISLEEAYEIARLAVCGVVFEPPSESKMDSDYALSINIINIAALCILGKAKEFKKMFSCVTDSKKYEIIMNIWKTLDIHRMSPR